MDWMTLSPEEWTAVRLSLRVAIVATLVSMPLGIAIALILARGRFWGLSLLNGLVLLPLILPPVVTGDILLILCEVRSAAFVRIILALSSPCARRGPRLPAV